MRKILVIPLAGQGRRFKSLGYELPKQMLKVDDLTAFEHSLKSMKMEEVQNIFYYKK